MLVGVGPPFCTSTVLAAEVKVLPATLLVTTRTSYVPLGKPDKVFQDTPYGEVVSAAPRLVHVAAPDGDVWNWAERTPETPSAEFDVTATVAPPTNPLAAGAVTVPVGRLVVSNLATAALV
jgi:hypothetical protein